MSYGELDKSQFDRTDRTKYYSVEERLKDTTTKKRADCSELDCRCRGFAAPEGVRESDVTPESLCSKETNGIACGHSWSTHLAASDKGSDKSSHWEARGKQVDYRAPDGGCKFCPCNMFIPWHGKFPQHDHKCGGEDTCYHSGFDHVATSQHPEDPEQNYARRFQDLDEILAPGRGLGEFVKEEELALYK